MSNYVQLTANHTPKTQPTPAPDVFDRLDLWFDSPEQAYASWIAGHRLAPKTKRVYLSMWSKFCRWMKERGVGLDLCLPHHISTFLDANQLYREHRWRYVRLIERVFSHLDALGLKIRNPGLLAKMEGVGAGENELTKFLSRTDRRRLERVLREMFAAAQNGPQIDRLDETRNAQWTDTRDAVISALMVGAGMKVGEVVMLSVSCTWDDFELVVPANGRTPEHRARLLPIARDALSAWVGVLANLPFKTDRLLPAAVSRRRHDQLVGTASMHPSSVFRRVEKVLERAGITGERAAGQILRNTYAATLIDEGASDATLAECLGIKADLSAPRLRQQYEIWKQEAHRGGAG